MNKLAERIKEVRIKNRLTQKQFCEKVGITQATLSAYEKEAKTPNVNSLIKINKEFDVSIDWLLGLSENQVNKAETVSDVMQLILKLEQSTFCTVSDSGEHLVIKNELLSHFAAKLSELSSLLSQKKIDQELFDYWIEKTLDKYEGVLISEEVMENE